MRRILFVIPILLLLISCASTKTIEVPVPVETIKTEYIKDTRIDSVFVRDSIDRWRSGDTVYIYKERFKFKYLNKVDTIVQRDTIPTVVELKTIQEVEVNHIYWYQKILMWLGGIWSLAFVAYIILKLKLK